MENETEQVRVGTMDSNNFQAVVIFVCISIASGITGIK